MKSIWSLIFAGMVFFAGAELFAQEEKTQAEMEELINQQLQEEMEKKEKADKGYKNAFELKFGQAMSDSSGLDFSGGWSFRANPWFYWGAEVGYMGLSYDEENDWYFTDDEVTGYSYVAYYPVDDIGLIYMFANGRFYLLKNKSVNQETGAVPLFSPYVNLGIGYGFLMPFSNGSGHADSSMPSGFLYQGMLGTLIHLEKFSQSMENIDLIVEAGYRGGTVSGSSSSIIDSGYNEVDVSQDTSSIIVRGGISFSF